MPRDKTVWKHQLIVMLVCSPTERGILDDTKVHLEEKAGKKNVECNSIELDTTKEPSAEDIKSLKEKIAWLGDGRLYIAGHGDWENQKVGHWDAGQVAKLVGVEGASFQLVSLTGCRVGRDKLDKANPRQEGPIGVYVANSLDSFASKFHLALGQEHALKIDVYARVFGTQADKSPTVLTMLDDILDIQPDKAKAEALAEPVMNAVIDKKLRFYWVGETQKREWVPQGSGAAAVFD